MLTNYISVWNVCMRNNFAKDKHYHHNQHSNSLHCPLHWWSFRDQVNICWNHTKPNCNAWSRTDSINHTSNLYRCLYVHENGYWNQIIHSIHSVHWMEKLVKPCRPYQNIEAEFERRQTLFKQGTLFLWYQWCFSSIIPFMMGKQFRLWILNMQILYSLLSRTLYMWSMRSMRIWYDCILII